MKVLLVPEVMDLPAQVPTKKLLTAPAVALAMVVVHEIMLLVQHRLNTEAPPAAVVYVNSFEVVL